MKTERGGARGRRGVPEAICMSVLAAALWAGLAGAGLAQVPDNRDLRLDPEDSVPPFYRETLDERDRQRLDAARAAGETYLPTFQGPSSAPGTPRRPPPRRVHRSGRSPCTRDTGGRNGVQSRRRAATRARPARISTC